MRAETDGRDLENGSNEKGTCTDSHEHPHDHDPESDHAHENLEGCVIYDLFGGFGAAPGTLLRRSITVSPIRRNGTVLGRIAGGSTTALVQAVLILLLSIPLGGPLASPVLLPVALLILVLIAVTFVGFGVALASQFSDSVGFGLIVQFVIFPLFFLAGAIYPIESLPNPVQVLAFVNPLTYGIDGLRAGASAYPLGVDLGMLLVCWTVMVGTGTYLSERVEAV